jgi:acetyltransferase-like isoleucine patch superfamily enzyme
VLDVDVPTRLIWGPFRVSVPRTVRAFAQGRHLVVAPRHRVKGIRNIQTGPGHVGIGMTTYGFTDTRMAGLVRVRGSLRFEGNASIGKGSRWDVGPGAVVRIGDGTMFGPNTLLVASTGVTIGRNCGISWGTQILDDDFHWIRIGDKIGLRSEQVIIGDHVAIANSVRILKGVVLADGCLVGAGSVVTRRFEEPNCLIVGNPARVVARDVEWDVQPPAELFAQHGLLTESR